MGRSTTWLLVLLTTTTLFELSSTRSAKKVNNCSCQRNGNKYIQLAGQECTRFTQYDNITKLTHTHRCPEGLRFSVDSCVCEHFHEVACEGCGPPACEIVGKERFQEIVDLQKAGDCSRALEIHTENLATCIHLDPVASMLIALRYIYVREKETQCSRPLVTDGCRQFNYCLTLMLAPVNSNSEEDTPKFLCENYKAASRCLRCSEDDGCQIAADFRFNLRVAAEQLCPHIQEFTCPADI